MVFNFYIFSEIMSCGQTTRDNNTYLLQNDATNAISPCTYNVCPCNNNICRIRYDFMVSIYDFVYDFKSFKADFGIF